MSLVCKGPIFRQKNTLVTLALACFSSISWATYSDVNSMLEALRPNAPVIAPQLNTLILSLDGLNPIPIQRRDALLSLAPAADGSLRVTSDAAMHEMHATIFDRVQKYKEDREVKVPAGINCGDEHWRKMKLALQSVAAKATGTQASTAKATATKTATDDIDFAALNKDDKSDDKAKTDKPTDAKAKDKDTKKVSESTADDKAAKETTTETTTGSSDSISFDDKSLLGDILNEPRGAWLQILGMDTWQYERDAVPGYHADMLGLIIGRDHQINDGLFIGIAGGYQQTDVDTKGLSGSYLDVKRYNATLYGRFDFSNCPIFVNLALTLALNNYDNNRYILVPPAGGTGFVNIAHGDFDGWETNAHLETGYTWSCNHVRVIPKAIIEYSHMEFNNYEEHDAFFLDLNVKYDNMNTFNLGVGAQVDYRNDYEKVSVIPEAHLYVYHDFINAKQVATANFYSGGYAFLSEGAKPDSNTLDFGLSLNVHSDNKTMVKIQYDFVTRSDYHRNEVFIKLRHEWV
ncbi:MAG: autotransporter domain-containing protein [Candidatus Berkiella sp.]